MLHVYLPLLLADNVMLWSGTPITGYTIASGGGPSLTAVGANSYSVAAGGVVLSGGNKVVNLNIATNDGTITDTVIQAQFQFPGNTNANMILDWAYGCDSGSLAHPPKYSPKCLPGSEWRLAAGTSTAAMRGTRLHFRDSAS